MLYNVGEKNKTPYIGAHAPLSHAYACGGKETRGGSATTAIAVKGTAYSRNACHTVPEEDSLGKMGEAEGRGE